MFVCILTRRCDTWEFYWVMSNRPTINSRQCGGSVDSFLLTIVIVYLQ